MRIDAVVVVTYFLILFVMMLIFNPWYIAAGAIASQIVREVRRNKHSKKGD